MPIINNTHAQGAREHTACIKLTQTILNCAKRLTPIHSFKCTSIPLHPTGTVLILWWLLRLKCAVQWFFCKYLDNLKWKTVITD